MINADSVSMGEYLGLPGSLSKEFTSKLNPENHEDQSRRKHFIERRTALIRP